MPKKVRLPSTVVVTNEKGVKHSEQNFEDVLGEDEDEESDIIEAEYESDDSVFDEESMIIDVNFN
jgi:hypothetical protein